MTATCTLCGVKVSAPDDIQLDAMRGRRSVTGLAIHMADHINRFHVNEEQSAVDRASSFPPSKPNTLETLIEAASANASIVTMLSYLKSEDPAFQIEIALMRDVVQKAMAQKAVKPAVVIA